MSPAISIICPIYNKKNSLRKCIDSIMGQTFTDFELLLIDDGSIDGSGEICDEYANIDNRIRVFHKINSGVSETRQKGVDEAKGIYTIHVDPDDWVEASMLEILYKKAIEDCADMVIADYYVNTPNEQFYEIQKPAALDSDVVLFDMFKGHHANCWNKLIRKECYLKYNVMFPKNISFKEDFCVIVQILLHPIKISYVNRAFYHYVKNSNSLSSSVNLRMLHDQLAVIDLVKFYLKGNYPECLNILKADVACWLVETGFRTSKEVKKDFGELLKWNIFRHLPLNRKVKILLNFYVGKKISLLFHCIFSQVKAKLKS